MNIKYLMLSNKDSSDIEYIINQVQNLNDKINLIDSNLKFNIEIFFMILSVMIAICGFISFKSIKFWIEEKIDKCVSGRLEEIISRVDRYEIMNGEKRLSNSECVDEEYSFIIGNSDLNINFDRNNIIDIRPINGQDELKYKAKVISGKLIIKFENFDKDMHSGIKWRIVYLK